MQRRAFMLKSAATLAATGLVLAGCTTSSGPTSKEAAASDDATRRELDSGARQTIDKLYSQAPGSRELAAKAAGMLVFPSVIAAGFGVGGEYGKGELLVGGRPVAYYSIASASFGLQIGAQSKSVIFLFMTKDALDKFQKSEGWSAGVDASVAVMKVGANGVIDTNEATAPVLAFVLTNAGLMANLSLEGTKISRLKI